MSIQFQYSDHQYANGFTFQDLEENEFFVEYKNKELTMQWTRAGVVSNIEPFSYEEGGKLTRQYRTFIGERILVEWQLNGAPPELEKILLEYDKDTLAPRREQRDSPGVVPPYPGGDMGGGDEQKAQLRL